MADAKSNLSAFQKKLKNADEALNKGRKGRRGLIEVDPGNYAVRFQSLVFGLTQAKEPFSHLTSIVVDSDDPDDIGLRVADRITFVERSGTKNGKDWKITEADHFTSLCTSLQSFGIDTSELEMDDLEAVADSLSEDQPACAISVVEKNGYSNVRWGKLIEDDEFPSLEDALEDGGEEDDEVEEEDDDEDTEEEMDDDDDDADDDESDDGDDEEDEDEEDEVEDEEDDDEEDAEELPPVVRGEEVKAQPGRTTKPSKYVVKTSNKKKETCKLMRVSDKREFENVPWDKVIR